MNKNDFYDAYRQGDRPYPDPFRFDHQMIEQLLQLGFEPHFKNHVDYSREAWDRAGRPPGEVDVMIKNWPDNVAQNMYMSLYDDGVFDFHQGTVKGFTDNPLGLTLARYSTDSDAPESTHKFPEPMPVTGAYLPPPPIPLDQYTRFSMDHVRDMIKHVDRKLNVRRRTTRVDI